MKSTTNLHLKRVLCSSILVSMIWFGKVQAQTLYDYVKPYTTTHEISHNTESHILKIIILQEMNRTHEQSLERKLVSNDIESIKYIGAYKLKGMENDSLLIFRVQFNSANLPMTFGHFVKIFIINNKFHRWYFVNLDTAEPIKIKEDDNSCFFAGRYKDRYCYGIFKVYEFNNGVLTQIYQTDKYVSNYSLDCISYENDDLELKNDNIEGNEYLGLKFNGTANYYCTGYENYGRNDKEPIRTKFVSLIYLFDKEKHIWIFDKQNSIYID